MIVLKLCMNSCIIQSGYGPQAVWSVKASTVVTLGHNNGPIMLRYSGGCVRQAVLSARGCKASDPGKSQRDESYETATSSPSRKSGLGPRQSKCIAFPKHSIC